MAGKGPMVRSGASDRERASKQQQLGNREAGYCCPGEAPMVGMEGGEKGGKVEEVEEEWNQPTTM